MQPEAGVTTMPSPFNPSALSGETSKRSVYFADCTLRDGEQQAGVVFNRRDRLAVARALDELGVHEIEAGTPAVSPDDAKAIGAIVDEGLNAHISVLCRALPKDIDLAMSLGAWGVRISFPASKLERQHKFKGLGDEESIERALSIAEYAKNAGAYVVFSPYDTTRADVSFLEKLIPALSDAGTVDRFRVVDTTGCATPDGIASLIGMMKGWGPVPLEIHCHNDFGLATANAIAGVLAGADFVSSTMNGIGERSGNSSTEEVALALECLHDISTGMDLSQLTRVSQLVTRLSRVPMSPNKAVVGANAFSHESGMSVAAVIKDPFTAEAYAPELVGQERKIVIGKMSGMASVEYKANQLGITVDPAHLPLLLEKVKSKSIRARRTLTDVEFLALCEAVAGVGAL